MELAEGQPIDTACDQAGATVDEHLALLQQVCEAVAHAHAHLVVHRDLKPHNIVVTPQGQVKLLDFGIARLRDGAELAGLALTELSGRALTPAFAGPEQMRGEPLGVATAVYGIGVVAFLLLSGRMPYPMRRGSAVAVDPARRRQLRGDLDAILQR